MIVLNVEFVRVRVFGLETEIKGELAKV
jgi:hypothetical protein